MQISINDKVTFDSSKVELFKADTSNSDSREVRQYYRLVLSAIGQIGTVTEVGTEVCTVEYADGFKIPMPTKYLAKLN